MKFFKNMFIFSLIISSSITIQSGWLNILCCCCTAQKEKDQSPSNNIVNLQTTAIIQNNQSSIPTPQNTPVSENIPNNVTVISVISDYRNDNNFLTPPNNSISIFSQDAAAPEIIQNGIVIDSRLISPRLSNIDELQINVPLVESKYASPRELVNIPSTLNNPNEQTLRLQQLSEDQGFSTINNPIRNADIILLPGLQTSTSQDSLPNLKKENNLRLIRSQPSIVNTNHQPVQFVNFFKRSDDDLYQNDQDQNTNHNHFRNDQDDFTYHNNYVSPQISPRLSVQVSGQLPNLIGEERALSQTQSNTIDNHNPSNEDTNVNQVAQILSSNKIDCYRSTDSKSKEIDQNPNVSQIFLRSYKYRK